MNGGRGSEQLRPRAEARFANAKAAARTSTAWSPPFTERPATLCRNNKVRDEWQATAEARRDDLLAGLAV